MKKFLSVTSLLLVAVMLLGIIPASAEVSNPWDIPEGVQVYYANNLSGKTAPIIDGEISDDEYGNVTAELRPANRLAFAAESTNEHYSKIDDNRVNQPTSDLLEFYFAYDENNIYIAMVDYGGTWAEGTDTYQWLQTTKAADTQGDTDWSKYQISTFAARCNYHFNTSFFLADSSSYFSRQASSRGFDENKWFAGGRTDLQNQDERFGKPQSIVKNAYIKKSYVADGTVFADAPGGYKIDNPDDANDKRANVNQFQGQYKAVIELQYDKKFIMDLMNELYTDSFVELPNAMWFWLTLRTYVAGKDADNNDKAVEGDCLAYNRYFATDIRTSEVDYSMYGIKEGDQAIPNLIVFAEPGEEISEGKWEGDGEIEEEEEEEEEIVETTEEVEETEEEEDDDAKTTTEASEDEEEKKGGCGSTVGIAGLALITALGTCTVFVAKKKED